MPGSSHCMPCGKRADAEAALASFGSIPDPNKKQNAIATRMKVLFIYGPSWQKLTNHPHETHLHNTTLTGLSLFLVVFWSAPLAIGMPGVSACETNMGWIDGALIDIDAVPPDAVKQLLAGKHPAGLFSLR